MAVELAYDRFGIAARLCEGVEFGQARAKAALLHPRSRLFVDRPDRPRVALLCLRRDDIWLLAGQPDRSATRDVIEHVADSAGMGTGGFLIRPGNWLLDEVVTSEFGCGVAPTRVLAYEFDSAATPQVRAWRDRLPSGCQVRCVDAELLARLDRSVDPEFTDLWPDPEEFLAQGVAFCLLWQSRPASLAWSYGTPTSILEIAVGTAPFARRRGFCVLAASALLEYCLDRQLTPVWMTWESNVASQAAASRLGFVHPTWHHWLRWTPFHAHRTLVPLPEPMLQEFAGRYRVGSAENTIQLLEDNRLILIDEQGDWQLLGIQSDTRLFVRDQDIVLDACRDAAGHVTGFLHCQTGRQCCMERC